MDPIPQYKNGFKKMLLKVFHSQNKQQESNKKLNNSPSSVNIIEVAKLMKEKRMEIKISLMELSNKTKISINVLKAIESQ